MENENRYEMVIGGVTVLEDGKVIACMGPVVNYREMEYKHLLAMQRWITSTPASIEAFGAFHSTIGPLLVDLGETWGLKSGKMKEGDKIDL